MFIDASAPCAMIVNEDDASALLAKLYAAEIRTTSPLAVWETAVAVSRKAGIDLLVAEEATREFLRATATEIIPITAEMTPIAIAAHRDFGKGRHSAALNFGDCFAYACARHLGLPLLFKGNDFSQTDISLA